MPPKLNFRRDPSTGEWTAGNPGKEIDDRGSQIDAADDTVDFDGGDANPDAGDPEEKSDDSPSPRGEEVAVALGHRRSSHSRLPPHLVLINGRIVNYNPRHDVAGRGHSHVRAEQGGRLGSFRGDVDDVNPLLALEDSPSRAAYDLSYRSPLGSPAVERLSVALGDSAVNSGYVPRVRASTDGVADRLGDNGGSADLRISSAFRNLTNENQNQDNEKTSRKPVPVVRTLVD